MTGRMKVRVLREEGYDIALYGLSLSYSKDQRTFDEFSKWFNSPFDTFTERIAGVAQRLSGRDNGENKYLESIVVWMEILAPRYWWQQFDTYRTGVSKQSASTMHTITKRHLTQDDFVEDLNPFTINHLNKLIDDKDFRRVKMHLPESYLQMRQVTTNYRAIKTITYQRKNHRLNEWRYFYECLKNQLAHSDLIFKEEGLNDL